MIIIKPDFISPSEEKDILSNLRITKVKRTDGRNSIIRYGSTLPYQAPVRSKQIPPYLYDICERVDKEWEKLGHPNVCDSVTINEYLPTQSIDWHVDSLTSGPIISVLSLESEAIMGLRNPKTKENADHILPIRSLLLLTEEHRFEWEHSIHPVLSHRFSIVFRKGVNI